MAKVLWAVVLLWSTPAALVLAQPASPAMLRERYESLSAALTTIPVELIAKTRGACVTGEVPANIARARSFGSNLPDASDSCPTDLLRLAREGMLLTLYRDLMVSATGQSTGHEQVPSAIAAAAMRGSAEVTLGNRRAVTVSTALAFDAGFTMAYQQRQSATPAMPALPVLKPIAERCLGGGERDRGLCYATGYTYGARAVSGQPLVLFPQ